MDKQLSSLQERIRNGEAYLNTLKPDDPKCAAVKARIDNLKASVLNAELINNSGEAQLSIQTYDHEISQDHESIHDLKLPSSANMPDVTLHLAPEHRIDPRPDLTEDAHLWTALLELAHEYDDELCGTLNGFRCGGTRLRFGESRWVLRPDIDPTGNTAWQSILEYDEMKEKYLNEWGGVLRAMLDELTKRLPSSGRTSVQ